MYQRVTSSYGGDWGLGTSLPWQLRLGRLMVGLEAFAIPGLLMGFELGFLGPHPFDGLMGAVWEGPSGIAIVLACLAATMVGWLVWLAVALRIPHRLEAFGLAVAIQALLIVAALTAMAGGAVPPLACATLMAVAGATLALLLLPASRRAAYAMPRAGG
jgi:hypothetical protein